MTPARAPSVLAVYRAALRCLSSVNWDKSASKTSLVDAGWGSRPENESRHRRPPAAPSPLATPGCSPSAGVGLAFHLFCAVRGKTVGWECGWATCCRSFVGRHRLSPVTAARCFLLSRYKTRVCFWVHMAASRYGQNLLIPDGIFFFILSQ